MTDKHVNPFQPGAGAVQASQSPSAAHEAAPEAPSEETPNAEKDDDGAPIPAIVLELKFHEHMSEEEKKQHMTEWQMLRTEHSINFANKMRKEGKKGSENILPKVSEFQFDVEDRVEGKYSWKQCVISSPYQ